ncbi:hypothetical protein AVEN_255176-1 [Araneus ventricosus]|uniref:DUF5641 domain-containing protein n=1 Tax=Araneus ventricosus TaxID=182803 RepID=A0A4Y2BCE0_ARAVE|nr:hypothetical protein AVEN_255176-1 [Araneus ventricosus]
MQWLDELKELSKIKIPRRLGYGSPDNWTLHVFCDASLDAYAAVIFLRSDNQGEIILRFVGSRSRVSPLKMLIIPRLELLACLLGARFAKYIVEALDIRLKIESENRQSSRSRALIYVDRSSSSPKPKLGLFTCAVYRAIHLEVVTSLSTKAFIQSPRRFIARGRPTTIYSDNGTNFTGTHNALREIDWESISSEEPFSPIKWKFIPSTAAWWGGWWERLIGSVKTLLLRVLGRSSLNYEELLTVSCDLETTISSRPLTYLSDEMEELMPLTPSLFLQDLKQTGVPDLYLVDPSKLNIRVKHCDSVRKELRSRFRKEYLSQLVQKASVKGQSLKTGDVVLVGLDNRKRIDWPMGRVEKIYSSRDGFARVARVKTKTGSLVRPIQKLYLLEVSEVGDPVLQIKPERRSRYGRLL